MIARPHRFALTLFAVLALSGCSVGSGTTEPAADGGIQLAITGVCPEQSEQGCTQIDGEAFLTPKGYQRAGVSDAGVRDEGGQAVINVTLDADGAGVLQSLTREAFEAGGDARLVFKVGDEVLSAVTVMQPLKGDQISITVGPEANAQQLVDLISAG